MPKYQEIFNKVESTLIKAGTQKLPEIKIREKLNEFKLVAQKDYSDSDYFKVLIYVPFYSGFKAQTVNNKMGTILRYFSDSKTVSSYTRNNISCILNDPDMIRHKGKVEASVANAKTFCAVVERYGSFQNYIDSFYPKESIANLIKLKRDLCQRFKYFGKITVYHFLTDIGMPVLKPDRVIRRIFHRLALIECELDSEECLTNVVSVGDKFAKATANPIRYIDIVFVTYGQVRSDFIGIENGICVKDNPLCSICGVREHCDYLAHRSS